MMLVASRNRMHLLIRANRLDFLCTDVFQGVDGWDLWQRWLIPGVPFQCELCRTHLYSELISNSDTVSGVEVGHSI